MTAEDLILMVSECENNNNNNNNNATTISTEHIGQRTSYSTSSASWAPTRTSLEARSRGLTTTTGCTTQGPKPPARPNNHKEL